MSVLTLPQKQCRTCHLYKDLDDFHLLKGMKDGHNSKCKQCDAERRRQQYYLNHDRELAAARRGRERQDKEAVRAYAARYREVNSEKVRASIKAWRQKNKDRVRQLNRDYTAQNRAKVRLQGQVRYAARRRNGGSFTTQEWIQLCESFGNMCVDCGVVERLTVDHVIPLTFGGTSDIENIQPLCKSCNSRKGNRIMVDYRLPWKRVSYEL